MTDDLVERWSVYPTLFCQRVVHGRRCGLYFVKLEGRLTCCYGAVYDVRVAEDGTATRTFVT